MKMMSWIIAIAVSMSQIMHNGCPGLMIQQCIGRAALPSSEELHSRRRREWTDDSDSLRLSNCDLFDDRLVATQAECNDSFDAVLSRLCPVFPDFGEHGEHSSHPMTSN
mmetsp:Transcript_97381/g.178455  ORF Transcript_97381/g.178455 Transcript_97381/m.178455 type:complete len:109 (-) Transcript_97381:195-521(-)